MAVIEGRDAVVYIRGEAERFWTSDSTLETLNAIARLPIERGAYAGGWTNAVVIPTRVGPEVGSLCEICPYIKIVSSLC